MAARHLLDWGAEVIVYLVREPRDPARLQEILDREAAVFRAEDDPGFGQLEALLVSADLVALDTFAPA